MTEISVMWAGNNDLQANGQSGAGQHETQLAIDVFV